jgi:amidase
MSGAVFILPFDTSGSGRRLAIKDLIDLKGTKTTAGCRAVADAAVEATVDAACVDELRHAEQRGEIRFVGKTTLHELAFGADGINPEFGTPFNPVDPLRIPGGSSSGSAVAIAADLADLALGTDTGGSIRIPAACCEIVGLKTTWGRISNQGVWPLAPFLDTVGPMANSVSATINGMDLLEPGFLTSFDAAATTRTIGRIRLRNGATDPAIDAAVDQALLASGTAVLDVTLPYWMQAHEAAITVLLGQAWQTNSHLLEPVNLGVSAATASRLRLGTAISAQQLREATKIRTQIVSQLQEVFSRFDVLALATLPTLAPLIGESSNIPLTALTRFANIIGLPALAMPIPVPPRFRKPSTAHLRTSLQLIGPPHGEAAVLRAGLLIESVLGNGI